MTERYRPNPNRSGRQSWRKTGIYFGSQELTEDYFIALREAAMRGVHVTEYLIIQHDESLGPQAILNTLTDVRSRVSPQPIADAEWEKVEREVMDVFYILHQTVGNWRGKKMALVGTEDIREKALMETLQSQNVPVRFGEVRELGINLKDAEVIISTTMHESSIKPGMIQKGAVLIELEPGGFDPTCYAEESGYRVKTLE